MYRFGGKTKMTIYKLEFEDNRYNFEYNFRRICMDAIKEIKETGENYIGCKKKGVHIIPLTAKPILVLKEEGHKLGLDLEEKAKIGF